MAKYDVNTGDPRRNYINLVKGLFESAVYKGMHDQFQEVTDGSDYLTDLPRMVAITGMVSFAISGSEVPPDVATALQTLTGYNRTPQSQLILNTTVVVEVTEDQYSDQTDSEHVCLNKRLWGSQFLRGVREHLPTDMTRYVGLAPYTVENLSVVCTDDCDQ